MPDRDSLVDRPDRPDRPDRASDDDVGALPARIEALLDELAATGDSQVADCGEELVAAVVSLYGAGLHRVIAIVAGAPGGDQLLRELSGDDLVANLLLLHGLHPDDVGTRIELALARVRPYLGSHSGGIEYVGVDEAGVAHLRLEGSCDGCAGSAATVHQAVERAVLDAAPEISAVAVEGVVEPAPTTSGLLQIGRRCPDGLIEAVQAVGA
jgi:Fe-S cluster biogenesis protein NfuA